MQSEPARAIAEQAVVREVILRGWLSAEQVEAARRGAPPGELLVRLRAALAPAQQAALAEVYRAALRQASAASSPGASWPGPSSPGAGWPGASSAGASWSGAAAAGGWGASAPAATGGWGALRSVTSSAAAAIPPWVGPYAIEQELARGGMGVIMVARHRELGRRVALKLMLPEAHASEGGLKRFEREAQAVARLGSHRGIVRLYEYGEEGPLRYLAMELVPGGSLAGRLEREGPLPPLEAARLVEQLARTLHVAHTQGVLHRDLKPANVLLDEEGRPKVTDFGIAKDLAGHSEQLTKTGAALGTPAFAPPEQVGGAGEVDARSDVYALGATLYALLTGDPPFEGPSALNVISSVIRDEPRPPSVERARAAPGRDPAALAPVPADLDTICLKCLEKRPAERYPSAIALADDLARFVAGEPIAAAPPGVAARLRKWRRRHPIAAPLLVVLPLVAALAAPLAWWGARPAESAGVAQRRALPPVWREPAEGFATVAAEVVLEGELPADAHWVEVWVRGRPRVTVSSGASFEYVVPLRPGKNEVTLRWAARGQVEGAPLTRVIGPPT